MGVNGQDTLPDGWEVVPLGAIIADLEAGVSVNGEDRPAVDGEIGVLKVSAVSEGRFLPQENKVVVPADRERVAVSPRRGDLLVSRSNGSLALVGESVLVFNDCPTLYLPDKLWRVVLADQQRDNPYWLWYVLNLKGIRQEIIHRATGTSGMRNISKPSFLSIQVPRPPRKDQECLAAVLSAWTKAEEICTSLTDAKTRLRLALLTSLLSGKRRLPDIEAMGDLDAGTPDIDALASNGLPDALRASGEQSYLAGIPKLGPLPSEWREVVFQDVLEVVERPVSLQDDEAYQLVTAKRSRGGIVPRETLLGRQILTKSQFHVATGDFLISRRQIIHGACGIVPSSLDGAIVSNEYATLRVKDGLLLDYLRYLTHTDYFQMTCFHASVGVAIEKMVFRLEEWLKHKLHLPPVKEQRRIASCIGWLEHEILLLAKYRDALKKQKKALMQLLLTGKIRVRTE
jgi:restriction endonuclease S subunit